MLPLREVTGNMPVRSEAIADAREYVEKRTVLDGRVMRESVSMSSLVGRPRAVSEMGEIAESVTGSRLRVECRFLRTRSRWPKAVDGVRGGFWRTSLVVILGWEIHPLEMARRNVEIDGEPKERCM